MDRETREKEENSLTGFDYEWRRIKDAAEDQNIVLTVHFRPDKKPKDKAEWFLMLSNYAKTTSNLLKTGLLPNKKTEDMQL